MSDIETEVVFAGQTTSGIGGIDGDFLIKNGVLVAIMITNHGEAGIMVHPQFNFESAPQMIKILNTMNRQATEVLSGMAMGNGQVH